MHLQNFLQLPSARQGNDGHHENQFETFISASIFPTHELKVSSFRGNRFFKTFALAATLAAAFVTNGVLAPSIAEAKPADKPVGTWGRTTASASYIRVRPGTQAPVVAKVPRGLQVMVWGTFDGWYRVETTDHKFGWMRNDTVTVPRAQKLKELSHAKAKQASDRTSNQKLYGNPAQLKKYNATYKTTGAKKPAVKIAAKAPVAKVVARPISYTPKSQPVMPNVTIITAEPVAVKPVAVKPVVVTIKRPVVKPVKATVKVAKAAPQKVEPVEATFSAPAKGGSSASISADDIMRERANYIKNQPTSRHKTRPTPSKSSASSVIKTAPAGKPIEATIKPMSSRGNPNAINAQPKPIYAQVTGAPVKVVKSTPSRGGSPRDYARYAAAKGDNKFGDGMATQALTYRGMPYISGASSPSRGFDCSGLVYYLLRTRGYNPPRTAAGFASYGKSVPRNQLKPGDLVLFANTYKRGISHIGIYTGNNNFVHAANSRSGVKTDSLSSSYYSKKYYGARRVK